MLKPICHLPDLGDRNRRHGAGMDERVKVMRRVLTACVMAVAASSAVAAEESECTQLGLTDAFLVDFYCDRLELLAEDDGTTRGFGTDVELPDEPWAELEIIQDAFRADPGKTLELIARIKGAGGLSADDAN